VANNVEFEISNIILVLDFEENIHKPETSHVKKVLTLSGPTPLFCPRTGTKLKRGPLRER
jgi:hypothetical protein